MFQESDKESELQVSSPPLSEESEYLEVGTIQPEPESQEAEPPVVETIVTDSPTLSESDKIESRERIIEPPMEPSGADQTQKIGSQQPKKRQKHQSSPKRSAPQLLQSIPRKERNESQTSGGRVRLLQEEQRKVERPLGGKAEKGSRSEIERNSEKLAIPKKNGRTFQFTQKMILPSIFAGMILIGVVWLLSVLNSYGLITSVIKVVFFYLASVGVFFVVRKKMPQMIFRQLLYGLAFAVAMLTTGAAVLLYHLMPLILGFVLSVVILLIGFWVSREEKSEILTIGMLVTSLLLPHLMLVENLSIVVVVFYSMVTVGFVSWFDKENQFQVSEVLKNIFTLFVILHIGQVSAPLLLLTLLLGLLLFCSNVFVDLRKDIQGSRLFMANSGIAAFVLVILLAQFNVASHQWLWPALVVWGVCLGLAYHLRSDARFQDLYFAGSSLFLLMAALSIPSSVWSTWNLLSAVMITMGYFIIASLYRMKWTSVAMIALFVIIEIFSLFVDWKDQVVVGVGFVGLCVWLYRFREKGTYFDWMIPMFVISGHIWFSLSLCIQRPDDLWVILILLLGLAALQQWLRPMSQLYKNYLLGYQAVLMYAALPIYLTGLALSMVMLWVSVLFVCAYLVFVADKQLRLPTYAALGAYAWIFVSQFSQMSLLGGLGYLAIGLLTLVGISYKKSRFTLLNELYVPMLIAWDLLLLIWIGSASENSICAILIGLSLSGLAIIAYQDWREKENWLLQNYLMILMIFGMFLFVLFLSVNKNAGMRFIALLLYVLFLAGFTYLERAYYCVRKPAGIQQIRLPATNLLIAWLFVLYRIVITMSQMLGSSDFVRDVSLSIVLFLYGLVLLWYGNHSKQTRFERYSLAIILYDFHGTSAMIRGVLFLVLGIVGFFTIWKVERK